jgi:hypothetical protein
MSEIDRIFGEVKSIKKEKAARAAKEQELKAKLPARRRLTDDGLPVFTEEELKMNDPRAGTTPLCPFDCDCCH